MKMVIILRSDVDMGKGKLVAQGSHAVLMLYLKAKDSIPAKVREWLAEGQKKIVLKADLKTMEEVARKADDRGIPYVFVRDAGHTQVPPGTVTALALGPWEEDALDQLTGHLKLL